MAYNTKFKGSLRITPEISFKAAMTINGIKSLSESFDKQSVDFCFNEIGSCEWKINKNGDLIWDSENETYNECWENLDALIYLFFAPNGYSVNGEIEWQGEEIGDYGKIIVIDNNFSIWNQSILVENDDQKRSFETLQKLILTSPITGEPLILRRKITVVDNTTVIVANNVKEAWRVTLKMEEMTGKNDL